MLRGLLAARSLTTIGALVATLVARLAAAESCPAAGGMLRVELVPPPEAGAATVLIGGTLETPSCTADGFLAESYGYALTCRPEAPDSCSVTVDGLHPGAWLHRVAVVAGTGRGQAQARIELLLDRSAGVHTRRWPLYRAVHTVTSLEDAPDCGECWRSALVAAEAGPKPALVQFSPDVAGRIVLSAAPPPLTMGQVTIDAFDFDGVAWTRILDGNGLNAAALRIDSAANAVHGLRVVGVGGDSDAVVLDGPAANDNLLDTLQVVGRSTVTCGQNGRGCVIDGVCHEPTATDPRGACGDDAIAVRNFAGTIAPNVIRGALISGAHDKGVKASDGGVAVVEDSIVFGNADGGLQATLSGTLIARRNVVISNAGTTSASGLAANGAAIGSEVPARLETDGNLTIGNAQRGVSIRSLSIADLHNDFVCGNGTAAQGGGAGMAVLDAAGRSATVTASGVAILHNGNGGVVIADNASASFGTLATPGRNVFAFNGPPDAVSPGNFRSTALFAIPAIGNAWEHCGEGAPCDVAAVETRDVLAALAPVGVAPALPTRPLERPRITAIEPPLAAAGTLVRIYGSGFDAIEGAGTSCDSIAAANTCAPLRGNCVLFGRAPAEVVAVTPTMLVVRAPATCVQPITVSVRTHWGRGFARSPFCTLPADADEP